VKEGKWRERQVEGENQPKIKKKKGHSKEGFEKNAVDVVWVGPRTNHSNANTNRRREILF